MHGVQFAARKPGGKGKPATAQRGSLLFSHRGVTGPAVLDLSHHAVMALERHTPLPGEQQDLVASQYPWVCLHTRTAVGSGQHVISLTSTCQALRSSVMPAAVQCKSELC